MCCVISSLQMGNAEVNPSAKILRKRIAEQARHLSLNSELRVHARAIWVEAGWHLPE